MRLRKKASRHLDFTHQTTTTFRNPAQTRKRRFSDYPIQVPINRNFQIFEATEQEKQPMSQMGLFHAPTLRIFLGCFNLEGYFYLSGYFR